ncbi:MAG: hypothetical protein U5J82_08695 [Desulfobacterales bacterium]|nr:hypothetical protein [Desulfobacterales bacterium]
MDPLIVRIEGLNAHATSGTAKPLGEILVASGAIEKADVEHALEKQKSAPGIKLGEILMDEGVVGSQEVISGLQQQKKEKRVVELQVKVDTHKLDNLVDLTGELVISQSMLRQNYQLRGAWSRGSGQPFWPPIFPLRCSESANRGSIPWKGPSVFRSRPSKSISKKDTVNGRATFA